MCRSTFSPYFFVHPSCSLGDLRFLLKLLEGGIPVWYCFCVNWGSVSRLVCRGYVRCQRGVLWNNQHFWQVSYLSFSGETFSSWYIFRNERVDSQCTYLLSCCVAWRTDDVCPGLGAFFCWCKAVCQGDRQFWPLGISLPASIRPSVRPWYLVNLLVRIREPSSPTGWQQSPQLQAEETKKSRKLDCITTGFIYDDAVNFTVNIRHQVCRHENPSPVQAGITKFGPLVKIPIVLRGDWR